ncbi:MAG: LemA family protein [Actinomycetia bacterium]|nr:LemA family protein [Actinomycetes bacterium]MCP4087782.1 LemA family protein [Actinomycetes bacterium]
MAYNRFVNQKQLVENAWSTVETELTRRHDLIPNLVETVKGYAAHEQQTLEAVVEARTRASKSHDTMAGQAADENDLINATRSLLALSEAYPDLKADRSFLKLQDELVGTENRIQAGRRFYNNNVRDLNRRVQSIPSNVVARLAGIRVEEYYQIDEAVSRLPPGTTI